MTPEEAASLRKPFPETAIGRKPKAGLQLEYVGHAATTDRLLQVDPDWTWEPMARDAQGLPALDEQGNLWIFLTVCGVTRPGVGDGPTAKERIGDAIRNAAMRFGVALDLWAKEDLTGPTENGAQQVRDIAKTQKERIQKHADPPPEPRMLSEKQRRLLFAKAKERGIDEERMRDLIEQVTGQRSTAGIPVELMDAMLLVLDGGTVVPA